MRRLICIYLFLNISINVIAQQQTWDSTYRPDIYKYMVDAFRSYKHKKKDIVFLGNSLTFWANWTDMLGSTKYKNFGIPGDVTYGVLDRLNEVINVKPSKVFILIGINDLARKIPDNIILQNYVRMIRGIRTGSPKTKVYFQSMLPTNASFNKLPNHYNKEENMKNINAALKTICKNEGIEFIDLYSSFVDEKGSLNKELTFDGVHLTFDGYKIWMNILKDNGYIK